MIDELQKAQKALRSTTGNWEECLFEVDEILDGLIQAASRIDSDSEIERLRAKNALLQARVWKLEADSVSVIAELNETQITIAELKNQNAIDAGRLREWTDTDIYLAESYVNDLDADIPPMPDRVAAIVNELMEARATIAQQAEQQELDDSEAAGIERHTCSTHGISWYTNTWNTCPVCDLSAQLAAAQSDADDLRGQLRIANDSIMATFETVMEDSAAEDRGVPQDE